MRKRLMISVICILSATMMSSLATIASAEEPTEAPTDRTIDLDGQKICGFDLMNDSEKAGYRNIMHKTKDRADRDEIRAAHCENMAKRAKEKETKPDK